MEGSASTPTQLGRYEIVKPLTSGGMAELLLARATGMQSFERHVVIKRIHTALARDPRFVKMFLDEARLAASLHHQNIVQVYDVGEQDGTYFFAMEYVHGEDLRKLFHKVAAKQGQIPLEVVIAIASATASGLHHAHEQVGPTREPLKIVHRDVSPGNILVGYDGSVKLVDFGLAKAVLRSVKTRTGTLKGKAAYMSPEQCMGRELDRRSDVFALGIVLYELLTMRRLYKAANDFLSMSAIVGSDVPPPSSVRADLPAQLDDIMARALAKSPEARYQSAEALRGALEQLALAEGLHTSPKVLSDYMVAVFGERLEPWRAETQRPSAAMIAVDDSSHEGIVEPPSASGQVRADSRADSPLAIAQVLARGGELPPEFADESATIADPPDEFSTEDASKQTTEVNAIGITARDMGAMAGDTPMPRIDTAITAVGTPDEDVATNPPAPRPPLPAAPPQRRISNIGLAETIPAGLLPASAFDLPPLVETKPPRAPTDEVLTEKPFRPRVGSDVSTNVADNLPRRVQEEMYVGPAVQARWRTFVRDHAAVLLAIAAVIALAIFATVIITTRDGAAPAAVDAGAAPAGSATVPAGSAGVGSALGSAMPPTPPAKPPTKKPPHKHR